MRNASTPPLLQLEDICVRFGFVEALKSVNLTIDRKEVIAIVGDNGAGKEMKSGWVRDDDMMNTRARSVLGTLSSAIRVGSPITSLSVGQRQTVAIARTLLNDPQLILLDEPTASLSVMQAAEVLSYIKRIRSDGRSVVMVCHDLPNVFAVSDRIVVIRQGRIRGVYRTAKTSYEEIIAQIAGVDAGRGSEGITENPKYANMVHQRKLIDRTISAAMNLE